MSVSGDNDRHFCNKISGNSTFMDILGSLEPDWNCTLRNGSFYTIKAPTNNDSCAFMKKNCQSYTAEKDSVEFVSLVADFKLICDDADKVKWIEITQAGGSLIGSIIGGHMGDHLGRKTIFFSGQLLIIITSMMSTASRGWIAYASIQGVNCFLYGVIEVTSLTMMMEYTNNKFDIHTLLVYFHTSCLFPENFSRYRVIMANAFQWPFAYMAIALIAVLTKGWQNFFVFLNLVSSPLAIGFMLFLESPRWLIATGKLDKACEVLNDIAHQRWNNTKARFTTQDISSIHKNEKKRFYTFFHLFSSPRLAKQSLMQILSMFTYAMVSNTYLYTVSGMHDSAIMFVFLDGIFRLFTPFIIIFLDIQLPQFGRKIQFIGALVIEGVLFGVVILLLALGYAYDHIAVSILVIITTMINDCVFWINIVQITTQRYPTVIRSIAFGSLHSIKHIGSIVGLVILTPLLNSWALGAFIIPEILIVITLITGFFLQPETKGKALMDQMVEANYGRLENELPRALIRLAAGHKVAQMEAREKYRKELEAAQAASRAGENVNSPWAFKNDGDRYEYQGNPKQSEKAQLNHFDNDGFDEDEENPESDLGIPQSSNEWKL
ncbi:transporter, major facilitator family protein [Necator americanus]|uniref:Transporter, major facilitator family protein n=1 Tax=Necator americanus TaxID=51031 RepID=W2TSH0_NECAM|nr:transporter, major facilitator family protein [Necator americanus]ETN84609.1 transporter, major facilitator family protein [Necator americanus]